MSPKRSISTSSIRIIPDKAALRWTAVALIWVEVQNMVEWLRAFHTKLAEALQNGEAVLDMLPE
jgi:hypothetical protein